MEFKIEDVANWIEALDKVRFASNETTNNLKGIQAHVRLCVSEGRLEMLAYDEVVTARTSFPVAVSSTGACCVPVRVLRAVLQFAPAGFHVKLVGERSLQFVSPHRHPTVAARPATDMPEFPRTPEVFREIPVRTLDRLLERTLFATDSDENRPERSCLMFRQSTGYIEAFASDGRCAAYAREYLQEHVFHDTVVHRRALREIQRVMSVGKSESIHIGECGNHLFFKTETAMVAVLKVSVKPTDITPLLHCVPKVRCEVSRESLIEVLDAAVQTTGQETVMVAFSPVGVEFKAADPDRGSTSDELTGTLHGEPVELAVNAKYLRSAASAIDGELVALCVHSNGDSLVVRPKDGKNAECVIMAMGYS